MKCKNCGHLNKTNTYYCVKCGSSLENSNPIRQYKNTAKTDETSSNVFTKTQKFLIALVIVGILIVVLSAVTPPDLEMPTLATPSNDTTEQPIEIADDITQKLNTTIHIDSISAKTGEKVIVNAFITDQNNERVKSGTTSINLFDIKYSGQVENGNVKIVLPELSENNYETTIVYEGNDEYNPSETKLAIEVNKENTQIIAETKENETIITLKTGDNQTISDAKIIITTIDTQTEQQTDENGQVHYKYDKPGKQEIKITYPGDEKYNPTETIIEAGQEQIETILDTRYNEQEKTITITLTDNQKHPINDAQLEITNNNQQTRQETDNNGIVTIPVNTGENKITINYPGNDTYKESQTTVNTVIEQETINTTQDNVTDNTTNDTVDDKQNTTIIMDTNDNQTVLTLQTTDNQNISGENIKILLDNGTQITEKTASNGTIILDLNLTNINQIELIYEGSDEYNPYNKTIQVKH